VTVPVSRPTRVSKFELIPEEEEPVQARASIDETRQPEKLREFKDLKSRPGFLEGQLPVFICVPCHKMFIKRKTLTKHQKLSH
jgi:hypothetical protein